MAELRVLGPIQGYRDGDQVDLGGPTQRRLLASLVAQHPQVVPVTALLEHLWGEDPPPSGPASIQSYVSRLRRVLGPDTIETKAPGYRLGETAVAIDSLEFLEMASNLPFDPGERLDTIESALAMWRGPAFEDFDHVDFASRRLTETRFDLEEERARLLAEAGQATAAVGALEKITAAEPLRESAWVTLGLVLSRLGRQAEAVRALDRYRSRLSDIGLEPGPAFKTAEAEIFEAPQATQTRPPLAKAETSFIGRAADLDDLRRLLDGNRLVTVVGPGGMGKTRLAVEVAGSITSGDVVFVRLDSLHDDREVAPAVLHALGGETRGDPAESVVVQLSRMGLSLLVLDNVEHVIETTASLISDILGSSETRILVTSREPLNTPGEVVHSLGPLDPTSAIELYRDRARSVSPDFEAPAATLDILCEELDYMPLAIEMAAARSKALAPDEILTRLSRRYGLLDKPLRGGAQRHRTLDALVDWSYSLLDSLGQRVFERISVVAGSFDVALATDLAGFGDVSPESVPGTLAGLVEKSLVERTNSGTYRMLRVLKSFAHQKLVESADLAETRTIHARWFGRLATEIGDGLSTPDETWWIECANAAVDDLGEALEWSVATSDLDTTQLILEGLFDWFYHRQPPAIVAWGGAVLPGATGHDVFSVASAWAALAAMKTGDVVRAGELAEAGTVVEGPAGRFAWFMTGEVAVYQDRLDDALEAYRRQLVRASNMDDPIGVIDAMAGEALALAFQGELDDALNIALDLEARASQVGAPTYQAYADYALAETVMASDPERAADLLQRAVARASSVNNRYIHAIAQTTLGSVFARLGDHDLAVGILREALAMWEFMSLDAYRWTTIQYLAALLAEQGDQETATKLLSAARAAGRRPLMVGRTHWTNVTLSLQDLPDYESWATTGQELTLDAASEMAKAATQPRR